MILRQRPQLGVAGGDQHPAVELMVARQVFEKRNRAVVAGAVPDKAALGVARMPRDRMVVGQVPDRDAVAAEAAGERQRAVGAADDEGAGRSRAAR
jgi:hypothetical protein